MPSEWEWSTLGNEALNASRPFMFAGHPTVIFVNTGDVLSGKFLHANRSSAKTLPGQAKKALRPHDILLTEIRPGNGRYAYVDFDAGDYVVSTKFMVIESKGRLLPRFLYHLLTNQRALDEFQRIAESRSGTFPQVTFDSISHFPIPVPGHGEQQQLAKLFGLLHARIDLLRQTNTTLESIAQTIFKSWFIDFDPVRAKAEGLEPEGMDATTAALFPAEFEESAVGLIPRGWRPGTLADFVTLNAESWTSKRRPSRVNYVDLGNVKDNRLDEITEYEFDDAPSRARRVLRSGDTIIGTVRPGNRSFAYIESAPTGLTGSTGFAVLSPNEDWSREFVYLAATRDENIERLANLADGGAYPAVSPELVVGTQVVISVSQVLEAFSAITAPLFSKQTENRCMERSLSDIRDALLPRLISGKLRIPEAQEQIEDALA